MLTSTVVKAAPRHSGLVRGLLAWLCLELSGGCAAPADDAASNDDAMDAQAAETASPDPATSLTGPACPIGIAPEALPEAGSLYSFAAPSSGVRQSPVDILTTAVASDSVQQLVVELPELPFATLENTGHSVQLNFLAGGRLRFNEEVYEILQLHFHTPSEHRLDGMTFPMEMHIVSHRTEVGDEAAAGDEDHYAVLGLFFKLGVESDLFNTFLDLVPIEEETSIDVSDIAVTPSELLPLAPDDDYYYYPGSLTTEPYTETVDWLVSHRVLEASPDQIACLNALTGDNARHPQQLGGREVLRF